MSASGDWSARATLSVLRARAEMLGRIRAFFAASGVMEVETPILSRAGATDPALVSLDLAARAAGIGSDQDRRLYLQTSPEFPMKRLLACGSGPLYQICKVFRGGERGRRHHPEFTLLEWYRPGWGDGRLMQEVAELVRVVLQRPTLSVERVRYRDLFRAGLDIDPFTASPGELREAAIKAGIPDADRLDLEPDAWLDLLLTQCLEPHLGRSGMSFLCDYPPSQAALARIRPADASADDPAVAERFELYIEGVELANGFHELTDAAEQGARFAHDCAERRRLGLAEIPPDAHLLAALQAGMPASSGVALGLDRLLMIATGARHIDEVLAFPIERA
jgi:elongation factor P--(R)-beta-lysine ligase